ncbi:MAG: hypothetical protein K2O65_13905, partial [Lachnospiraceae bacterium]|nr:hypothetical protein [Lachnospiraceae bacterium]
MILFMVKKSEGTPPERYPIPLRYPDSEDAKITESNVRFISWNEADYQLSDGTIKEIINIDLLKLAVQDAAMQDKDVCGIMIKQFKEQYSIDICALWDNLTDPAYHIIGDV